jgi:uncharacterized protein YndB with AHSA1/START domain
VQPSESDAVQREVRVAARPETVFAFLVEVDKMQRWFGRKARLDPRPGGLYRVDINGQAIATGKFLQIEPNRRVVSPSAGRARGSPFRLGPALLRSRSTQTEMGHSSASCTATCLPKCATCMPAAGSTTCRV